MKKIITNILVHTKKACQGRHSLLEVASLKMKFFSFVNDFSSTPQILRGNTKASQKLLLHTSIRSIVFSGQKVNSYPQGRKMPVYSMSLGVKLHQQFYTQRQSMSIRAFLQKACQLTIFWKVLSVSQGILYHENAKNI